MVLSLNEISLIYPYSLSDRNSFLQKFVGGNFLSVLGFMISLSMGSAINTNFKINEYEEKSGSTLNATRKAIKLSGVSLIVSFLFAVALAVVKPIFQGVEMTEARFNSAAIVLMYIDIAIMYDLFLTSMAIPPFRKPKEP